MRRPASKTTLLTSSIVALTLMYPSGVLADDKHYFRKMDDLKGKTSVLASEQLRALKVCRSQTMPTVRIAAGGTYKYEPQVATSKVVHSQSMSVRLAKADPKVEVKVLPGRDNLIKFGIWTTVNARHGKNVVVVEYVGLRDQGCEGKKNVLMVPMTITKPAVVSRKELLRLEARGLAGLETYNRRDFISKKSKADAGLTSTRMIRNDQLRGILQVRDLAPLPFKKFAGSKFYITPGGNVIRTANLARRNEVSLQAYFTYLPGRSGTLGVDADQDGDFDLLLGGTTDLSRGLSRNWILTTPLGEQLYSCLRAGRTITPQLLSGMIDAGVRGGIACPMLGGSTGGGGGGGGVGFSPPAGQLSDPDCSSSNGFGGYDTVSSGAPDEPSEDPPADPSADEAETPDLSPEAVARAEVERQNQAAREAAWVAPTPEPTPSDPGGLAGDMAATIDFIKEHVDFGPIKETVFPRDSPPDVGDLIKENQARDRQAPSIGGSIEPLPDDGNTPGTFEDPRCRRQEQSPGGGYFDPRTCSGENLTDCILRHTDPVYNVTGGRCRSVDGHAGGKYLECQSNEDMAGRDCRPDENPNCPNQCSPSDRSERCVDSVLAPQGESMVDYISVIGVGAVFGGLCHADGPNCPGDNTPYLGLDRLDRFREGPGQNRRR